VRTITRWFPPFKGVFEKNRTEVREKKKLKNGGVVYFVCFGFSHATKSEEVLMENGVCRAVHELLFGHFLDHFLPLEERVEHALHVLSPPRDCRDCLANHGHKGRLTYMQISLASLRILRERKGGRRGRERKGGRGGKRKERKGGRGGRERKGEDGRKERRRRKKGRETNKHIWQQRSQTDGQIIFFGDLVVSRLQRGLPRESR